MDDRHPGNSVEATPFQAEETLRPHSRDSRQREAVSFQAAVEGPGRKLLLQPRMGFGRIEPMRDGLRAVRDSGCEPLVGTVTVDAYTRVRQPEQAAAALTAGRDLNGFPITVWGANATRAMLDEVREPGFPVQVRHGSADPRAIFEVAAGAGIDAIEGGPVSYCLPYSRADLAGTVEVWREAAWLWARHGEKSGVPVHLESFGGCMFGQLCPPGPLIALTVLECLFFVACGVPSVSLSLTQGTNDDQDIGGLLALDRIRRRRLATVSSHVVAYTFMGVFPRSRGGAERLIRASARNAVIGGAQRLIVKTAAEAQGIPSVADNIEALRWARATADATADEPSPDALAWAEGIEEEAEALIEAVLGLSPDLGTALVQAFALGVLDIPYGLHPDNRGEARAAVDAVTGAMLWVRTGAMPLPRHAEARPAVRDDAATFRAALEFNRRRFDTPEDGRTGRALACA